MNDESQKLGSIGTEEIFFIKLIYHRKPLLLSQSAMLKNEPKNNKIFKKCLIHRELTKQIRRRLWQRRFSSILIIPMTLIIPTETLERSDEGCYTKELKKTTFPPPIPPLY